MWLGNSFLSSHPKECKQIEWPNDHPQVCLVRLRNRLWDQQWNMQIELKIGYTQRGYIGWKTDICSYGAIIFNINSLIIFQSSKTSEMLSTCCNSCVNEKLNSIVFLRTDFCTLEWGFVRCWERESQSSRSFACKYFLLRSVNWQAILTECTSSLKGEDANQVRKIWSTKHSGMQVPRGETTIGGVLAIQLLPSSDEKLAKNWQLSFD